MFISLFNLDAFLCISRAWRGWWSNCCCYWFFCSNLSSIVGNFILPNQTCIKEQKRKNDEFREFIKNEEQAQNKNKCEFIKTQQLLHEEKKRAQELEKMNKLKNELERKILEEQSLKEHHENKLVTLEQDEIDVMKRIRTTTQVHKASKKNLL